MSRPVSDRRPSQTPSRTSTTDRPTERHGRVPGRNVRRIALAASFLALPLVLSGCSGEWASMSPSLTAKQPKLENVSKVTTSTPTASTQATPTATPTVTQTPANPFAGGDLADGSLKRTRPVGDDALVISYWTEGTDSDVHLSAVLKGADRDHAVKVTRFAATLDSADGSEIPLAEDQGEFVLTPPYSYTSALAVPETEGSQTLDIRFDLLLETAPGSGAFYRQTVLDTVALNAADASDKGASK